MRTIPWYVSILNESWYNVCHQIVLSCSRTPVEGTHYVTTMRFASQDLQTKDIDVCAILDSRVNTATKVHVT